MKKVFKFHCGEELILLPLDQVLKISFIPAGEYDMYGVMNIITADTKDSESCYIFEYEEENKNKICSAMEDFYNNKTIVWELEKDLPFEV